MIIRLLVMVHFVVELMRHHLSVTLTLKRTKLQLLPTTYEAKLNFMCHFIRDFVSIDATRRGRDIGRSRDLELLFLSLLNLYCSRITLQCSIFLRRLKLVLQASLSGVMAYTLSEHYELHFGLFISKRVRQLHVMVQV